MVDVKRAIWWGDTWAEVVKIHHLGEKKKKAKAPEKKGPERWEENQAVGGGGGKAELEGRWGPSNSTNGGRWGSVAGRVCGMEIKPEAGRKGGQKPECSGGCGSVPGAIRRSTGCSPSSQGWPFASWTKRKGLGGLRPCPLRVGRLDSGPALLLCLVAPHSAPWRTPSADTSHSPQLSIALALAGA